MFVKNNINLSILIPCYNWSVYKLINRLHALCLKESRLKKFEIICFEDASTHCFSNPEISKLRHVFYEKLKHNLGRSKIRNLLATKAQHEWLLFIDADSEIKNECFIAQYINIIEKKYQPKTLYYGSTIYANKKPEKSKILHWKYGRTIESKRKKDNFSSHHFIIEKKVFSKEYNIKFNENITSYGYEDVFFVTDNQLNAIYINNPLYHIGLKDNTKFIADTESALRNLLKYTNSNSIKKKIKIIKITSVLYKIYLHQPLILIFRIFKSMMLRNLHSKNPSILLFQIYKLGYFLEKNN